jgi:hypothetical protein
MTVMALLVLACSTVAAKDGGASRSTVLLTIYVSDAAATGLPVDGLIVNITGDSQNPGGQFAFPADSASVSGRALFLVRAELLPGYYRLSRLSGVMRGSGDDLRFDVEVDMAFQVRAGVVDYLGSIELSRPAAESPGYTGIALTDRYKEDRPRIIRAWPALRSRTLQRRKPSAIQLVANAAPPEPPQKPAQGQYMPPVQLDDAAAQMLPAKARSAFKVFLKTKPPRAFAFAGSGGFGSASGGENVVGRALQNCRRASLTKQDCKLFVLDDTLVSAIDLSLKPPVSAGQPR